MSDEWNTDDFHEWHGPYDRSQGSTSSHPVSWFTRALDFVAPVIPAAALFMVIVGVIAVLSIYIYAAFFS